MEKTVLIKVIGKVQGVGFRWSSYEKFVEFGLVGQADNTPDGAIKITVTGEVEKLKMFLRWCQKGPVGARVEKMDYETIQNAEDKPSGSPENKED